MSAYKTNNDERIEELFEFWKEMMGAKKEIKLIGNILA